ncbi:hypothetical protein BKA69DRAFT_255312 [Paraphysoderma sedebokerense]|nr:hypothetical protein BKA69DRAFT_255312 [Paraphysoderma sedebokerense]
MGLMFGPKLRRVFSNNSTYSVNRHNTNSTSGLKRIGGQGSVGSANSSNSSWRKGSNIGSFFQPGRKLGLLNSTGTERNPAFIGRVHQEVLVVKKAEMASWFLMRMDRWEVSLVSVCPDTKILFLINRAGETSCFSYVDCTVHSITEYSADRVFVLDITVHDPKTVNLSFQLKTEKEAVYWSRLFDISTTLDLNSSYSGSLPRTLNKSDKALPPVPINIVRDYQRPPGLMGRLGLALNIDGDTLTDDSTSD